MRIHLSCIKEFARNLCVVLAFIYVAYAALSVPVMHKDYVTGECVKVASLNPLLGCDSITGNYRTKTVNRPHH